MPTFCQHIWSPGFCIATKLSESPPPQTFVSSQIQSGRFKFVIAQSDSGRLTSGTSLPDPEHTRGHPKHGMADSSDARLDWFRERLTSLMGVDDERYAATVIEENRDALAAFFGDPIESYGDVCKQVFFFWRTWYDRLVEETVTVLEEGNSILFLNNICE